MARKKTVTTVVETEAEDVNSNEDPWIGRSESMRCKTCMYERQKTDIIGRCRRHAPTMSGYPVVFREKDWCGDHKLDETKV
jgi:hypothetical protein